MILGELLTVHNGNGKQEKPVATPPPDATQDREAATIPPARKILFSGIADPIVVFRDDRPDIDLVKAVKSKEPDAAYFTLSGLAELITELEPDTNEHLKSDFAAVVSLKKEFGGKITEIKKA